MENEIRIEKKEYDDLRKFYMKYDLLLKAIFDSADLDLFNELRFDLEELQKAIKVLEPYKYEYKQSELINLEKLEEENNENN